MTRPAPVDYIMEDPREALRLERKVNPEEWIGRYLTNHLFAGAEVLSVGCGPGTLLRAISASDPTIHVTGVDISPDRIEQAIERNRGNAHARFVCGDAQALTVPSDSFDFVYARMLLQYLPDKQSAVAEMARVAKPGGKVMLQDLDGQLLWHYPEDAAVDDTVEKVVESLAATGFDPFVGRKLFSLARRAGLTNVDVKVECYHLIAGGIDPAVLEQWKLKLEIAGPCIAQALGSEERAAEQSRRFLDYLQRPDTLTYSNVFTITGEKPL